MKDKKLLLKLLALLIYAGFVVFSFTFDFSPGKQIGGNFISFSRKMLELLPCVFILIGLFEVWIKKEVITKHMGEDSGLLSYLWAILLAGPIAGGLLPAFPIAYTLYRKGAKLSVVFTFIGAAAVCRIPMTLFEAIFLGLKFSLVRLAVSIPLVIISSIWLGRFVEKNDYIIRDGE